MAVWPYVAGIPLFSYRFVRLCFCLCVCAAKLFLAPKRVCSEKNVFFKSVKKGVCAGFCAAHAAFGELTVHARLEQKGELRTAQDT